MLLLTHFTASLILIVILFPFFGVYSFIVLISGFFIDFDHIISYWIRFRNLSIKKAFDYYRDIESKKDFNENKKLFIFHSIEFIILIAALSFYYKPFLILLIGLIVHMIMDIIYEYSRFKTIIKSLSLIGHLKNAKKQN